MLVVPHKDADEEMRRHREQCDGSNDRDERFDIGDRVGYSEFGMYRLGRKQRYGEVAGFSDKHKNSVRVQFDGLERPMTLAHQFLVHESEAT